MNVFLDTSSLFKLYHQEIDSFIIDGVFTNNRIETIFVSDLARVEFFSTIWKKVRTKEIDEAMAFSKINFFQKDFKRYHFIEIDKTIIEEANNLLAVYGRAGLRTLDAIQLSTALLLKNQANLFLTSDFLLKSFFEKESLPVL